MQHYAKLVRSSFVGLKGFAMHSKPLCTAEPALLTLIALKGTCWTVWTGCIYAMLQVRGLGQ
jgi:hypothetical protein